MLLPTMKPTMHDRAKAIREAGLCVSIARGLARITRVFAREMSADRDWLEAGLVSWYGDRVVAKTEKIISVRLEDVTAVG